MKRVYIAHPFRGSKPHTKEKAKENQKRVEHICREIFYNNDDVIPISPINLFDYLDPIDTDPEKVIAYCLDVLRNCDELWVFNDYYTSQGCLEEIKTFMHEKPDAKIRYGECEIGGKIEFQDEADIER